jgi:hypothetical protein
MKGIFLLLIIVVIVASGCNKPISKIFDAEVKGTIESSIVETTAAPIPKTLFTGEVITIPFSAEGVKNPISKIELQASFDDGKIYTVVSTATDLSTRAISWTVGTTGGTKSYFRVKFTDSTNAVNYSNTFGPVGVYTRIDTIAGIDGFVQSFNGEGSDIKLTTPYSAVKVGNYLYIAEETDVRRIDLSVSPISSITFAGAPMITGSADGVGEAARFRSIRGITFDGDQYLYVADYTDNCIKRIKLSSQEVETFAGTCSLTGGTSVAKAPVRLTTRWTATTMLANWEDVATKTATVRASAYSSTNSLVGIGNFNTGGGNVCGFIRDIQFWNRSLSDAEVYLPAFSY